MTPSTPPPKRRWRHVRRSLPRGCTAEARQEKLEANEQRYRRLFHHMPVALWQLNARGVVELFKQLRSDGVTDLGAHFDSHPSLVQHCMEMLIIEEVNQHTVQMLGGRDTSEFVGTSIARYFPENSPTFRRSMISRYRGDPNYAAETKLFTLDGRLVDVLYTASRVGPATEPGMSLLGVIDITERRRAEEALRRSEQRYQNLFQAMAVSFFEFDFSHVGDLLRKLRASGVTDLRQHFKEHPETVRQFMRAARVVDVNEQTVTLFGQGARERLLDNVEPFWPKESVQGYAEAILSALEDKRSHSVEVPLHRVDGSVFDAQFTIWYSPDDPKSGLAAVIDITERKQAFLALETSEQRYRTLFNHMPIALAQVDTRGLVELFDGLRAQGVTDLASYIDAHPDFLQRCMEALIVTEANERMIQFHGLRDAGELIGTSVTSIWGARPEAFARSMESRFSGELTFEEETKLTTRDGRAIDVLFTASRVKPISGLGISLIGFMDISERVKAFSALEKSEQRYRHLFRNTPVAIWQINAQPVVALLDQLRAGGVQDLAAHIDAHPEFLSQILGAVIVEEVNDHAIRLFGALNAEELIEHHAHVMWREGMDTLRRAVESRWRGQEAFQETTRLVRCDGRVIDVLYTTARPRMVEGFPVGLVSMIDLTDRVRAQEELRRMQADFAHTARISMLGELTASIAHEVNQPLAAIAASGEASLRWLTRPTPDIGEVRELATRMVADARRASDIVARIRGMATPRVPEQALVSLDDVIREALVFLRHEVESRGVAVSHFPTLGSQQIVGDRTQLQQVVVNLAVNAMQAMAQAESTSRKITIRTVMPDAATLRCWVEDSGPGIAPQHVARLFDSFFTTKETGMGMGLRICRSVIEAHGGGIAADNESALGGARFFFTLPIAAIS